MEKRHAGDQEVESKEKPVVSVIMGSDSDLPIMKEAAEILEGLGVSFEVKIVSAHRAPDQMCQYARGAQERGLKVIIAGAGGAAHLPGMIAALTQLPVIGVPIEGKTLKGIDSLLSIAQMPSGIPVATMAINGAKNAGLFAARILAIGDKELMNRIIEYAEGLVKMIEEKQDRLDKLGYKRYLSQ